MPKMVVPTIETLAACFFLEQATVPAAASPGSAPGAWPSLSVALVPAVGAWQLRGKCWLGRRRRCRAAFLVCAPTLHQAAAALYPEVTVEYNWVIKPVGQDTRSELWCEAICSTRAPCYFASIRTRGIASLCRPRVRHRRIHITTAASLRNSSIRCKPVAKCACELTPFVTATCPSVTRAITLPLRVGSRPSSMRRTCPRLQKLLGSGLDPIRSIVCVDVLAQQIVDEASAVGLPLEVGIAVDGENAADDGEEDGVFQHTPRKKTQACSLAEP